MLTYQQIWISAGHQGQKQDGICLIADLVGTARKKDQGDLAALANHLEALIQLAVDEKAAADKEVIHVAPDREIDELV
jgi:hypothetical protein